ncbi:MAG: hypothetical protein QN169_04135 [Armatimonadota bacterium]|nr:hypothetical protein [Armatimonadota bacterium]
MGLMPDLTWDEWKTLISIAVAVIPAVLKFRVELTRAIDVVAEGVGLLVLVLGVLLYTHTYPQWERLQANLGPLSAESPLLAAQQVQTLFTLYAGSVALMVLGGLLAFSGLLGRLRGATKRR